MSSPSVSLPMDECDAVIMLLELRQDDGPLVRIPLVLETIFKTGRKGCGGVLSLTLAKNFTPLTSLKLSLSSQEVVRTETDEIRATLLHVDPEIFTRLLQKKSGQTSD